MREHIAECSVANGVARVSFPYSKAIREEVVRCRDCAYMGTASCGSRWPFKLDGFCAWGKREERRG